jgi:hypothetical protein
VTVRAYCADAVDIKRIHPNKKMDDDYKKSLEKGSFPRLGKSPFAP